MSNLHLNRMGHVGWFAPLQWRWGSGRYNELPTLHKKVTGAQCFLHLISPWCVKRPRLGVWGFAPVVPGVVGVPQRLLWPSAQVCGPEVFDLLQANLAPNDVTIFICESDVFVKKMHLRNNLISCVCLQVMRKTWIWIQFNDESPA